MENLYNVSDPYGTYQTKGDDNPYEILMRLKSWQNEIRSTISKVNENIGGIHEQQTQILQNIDSIELNVLDIVKTASEQTEQISQILVRVGAIDITVGKHTTDIGGHTSQIAQLLLDVGQVKINVSSVDSRLGSAEGTLIVQANAIASRVKVTDFTGQTVASMMVQDPYSISLMANALNLSGFVTFSSLSNNGYTTIHGGNIMSGTIAANAFYGDLFEVSRGTSYALSIYATLGSHRISSYDAAGLRIESGANLSLMAGWSRQNTVYSLSKFWAERGLQVTGTTQFDGDVNILYSRLTVNDLVVNGAGVVNVNTVQNMINNSIPSMSGYVTTSEMNNALRQKESEIVAWANGKFALK